MHADLPSFRISSPWPRSVEVLLVEVRFVDQLGGTLFRMREEGKGGEVRCRGNFQLAGILFRMREEGKSGGESAKEHIKSCLNKYQYQSSFYIHSKSLVDRSIFAMI